MDYTVCYVNRSNTATLNTEVSPGCEADESFLTAGILTEKQEFRSKV